MGYDIPSDHHSSTPRAPGGLLKEDISDKYKALLKDLDQARIRLEHLVLATPTGEERELLSGANIMLQTAIRDVKSAKKLLK